MKVLSYLEFMLSEGNSKIPDAIMDGYTEFTELYSQPFKPEMIMELFEGWDERHYQYGVFYVHINKSQEVHFDNDRNYVYIIYFDTMSKPIESYTPRTLDDFITDCQRVGIELEWKEVDVK